MQNFSLWTIKIDFSDLTNGCTCTCPASFKEAVCKHVLGLISFVDFGFVEFG